MRPDDRKRLVDLAETTEDGMTAAALHVYALAGARNSGVRWQAAARAEAHVASYREGLIDREETTDLLRKETDGETS